MKPIRYLLLCLAGLLAPTPSFPQSTSTQGREFWLSFMHNGFRDHSAGGWVINQVVVSAKRDCTGTVSNPLTGWSQSFSVSAGSITTVAIPEEECYHNQSQHERIYEKGIKVSASDTVSVYCTNIAHVSFDASFVLPVESLGDEYIVQCSDQSRGGGAAFAWNNQTSAFLIVATENNTVIDITPTVNTLGGRPADETFTVTMHAGETFHVRSERITDRPIDLSGTRIRARNCKRIAVFNGNTITAVPVDANNGYDHVFEQAMPLSSWGKSFVVTGSKTRKRDFVKVTSSADGNIVTMNGEAIDTLDAGQSRCFPMMESEGSCYLQATQPSAVYLYQASHDATQGDPSMVWIAPVEQRISDVTFSTFDHPDINIEVHCVNIIVKTHDVASVRFDGQTVPASEFRPVNGNGDYSYTRMDITHGVHRITCDNGFNAHVYGFGQAKGYAYLAGSNANRLSASLTLNGESVLPHETYPFCPDHELTFYADINLDNYDLLWDFGDGDTSTENPAVHTYREERVYNASLVVNSAGGGCWSQASDTTRFLVDASRHYSIHSEDVCEGRLYSGHGFNDVPVYNDTLLAGIQDNPLHPECQDSVLVYITAKRNVAHEFDTLACDAFEWDGTAYAEAGDIVRAFPASNGCDSIVTCHLALSYSPTPRIRCASTDAIVFGPDSDSVALVTNTEFFSFQYDFYVEDSEGHFSEWDSCVWSISKPSWVIEPFDEESEPGRHYCRVFVAEHSDTIVMLSARAVNTTCVEDGRTAVCYLKSSFLNIDERNAEIPTLHPNPTTGKVSVSGNSLRQAEVFNTLGQRLLEVQGEGDRLQIDMGPLPAGIYTLRVTTQDGKTFSDKVVKE